MVLILLTSLTAVNYINNMPRKDFTLTSKILMTLLTMGDMLLLTPREIKKRGMRGSPLGDFSRSSNILYYLARKGLIKIVDKHNQRFVKLTNKGQLEALLAKARLKEKPQKWDGKWRLIIFDIPENSREKRNHFRWLLRHNGFYKLQASVFINPYPLNREAVAYLKETGLMDYIRILKVEEMDSDKGLRKHFGLK